MKKLAILALLSLVGGCACVAIEVNTDHSKGGRVHQDVGRVTSSDQSAAASAEVPFSVVPSK